MFADTRLWRNEMSFDRLYYMFRYLEEHEFDDKTGMVVLPPGVDPDQHFKEAVERYAND